jgi:predicted nucleic acid-binding Zn ribbon protein
MSFKSVNDILGALQVQAKCLEHQEQSLLKCWAEVVGAVVAAHTQPLSIQRNVLQVATSSAAWAQNLTFERQRLLLKLNEKLSTPLVDIRFSTALWQRSKKTPAIEQSILSSQHPCYLGNDTKVPGDASHTSGNANATFKHWAETVRQRSHGLPLCPQCHCPTPPGELQRWHVCSLCAAKQF